jgi:hypothetical protein
MWLVFREHAFADEPTRCRSPDERAARTSNQALDGFCARPAEFLAIVLADQIQSVFEEEPDIVVND